jgi:hypothetical protein
MSTRELLLRETEEIPESLLQEVLDFLRFVKNRHYPNADTGTDEVNTRNIDLSKTAFAQDWDSPDEEEAWKDL